MKKTHDKFDLDVLLSEAKTQDIAPTAEFMERVLQDSLMEQAAFAPAGVVNRRSSAVRQFLSAIGGWPAVAGLATAGITGVWIGINPPNAVATTAETILGTSPDRYLVDVLPVYDFTLIEG